MKRHSIYAVNFLLSVLIFSCNSSGKNQTEQGNAEQEEAGSIRPNIIYILADDLGYGDLSCYGQENFQTPNIDKLASEGMRFTQHYSGSTVCAPSRSALMTGLHTGHTFIRGNKEVRPEGQYPLPDSTRTLPEIMKDAGYVTGAFGKWGLGYPGSEGDPLNQGFDRFYGYNCQRIGHNYYPYHLWSDRDSIVLSANADGKLGQYAPGLIQEQTLQFLEDNKDRPFFMYVPSIIPHAELVAPEKFMEKYRGEFQPDPAYEGVDYGPEFNKGPYRSQEEPHVAFAAMVSILDQQVGEIVKKVEELGIADNTIIVFTSDNGPHIEGGADPEYFDSNGPLRGTKRDLYEGGIRVPMIVKWPGRIKPDSETEHISAFWDVMPTFSEILDVKTPDAIDGISFLPTLLGKDAEQRKHEYLYWEFHERGGRQAVRQGKWKAVRYEVFKDPDGPLELYDLSIDIGEENDLADEHPEIIGEMERILDTVRTPSEVFRFGQETYLEAK